MSKRFVIWIMAALVVTVLSITAIYVRDMKRAYARIEAQGIVIPSPYGDIEYVEGGAGPVVLVVHGSGGGYDQGELIADAVLRDDLRWIAPSRFGYLRSTFHESATWDDQAHAYAYLLDELGVNEVAVVALSHGGPSALLFAALHPERVSSLTLISCGVASSSTSGQEQANEKGAMLTTIFEHDVLYWTVAKAFKKQLMGLMGADETVIAGLSPEQRTLLEKFIDFMNPVSPRSAGAAFDNQAVLPGERIASITAPTLIFHAVDDTLQLFHNAEFAVATIPQAKLIRFEKGGHFLIGVEQSAIREELRSHILGNAGRSSAENSSVSESDIDPLKE